MAATDRMGGALGGLLAAAAVAAAGCAGRPAARDLAVDAVRGRWLGWVADGATTRAETSDRLGPPTFSYEGGRVYAYRMYLDSPKRNVHGNVPESAYGPNASGPVNEGTRLRAVPSESPAPDAAVDSAADDDRLRELTSPAHYSLVLVFHGRGVLRSHALLKELP